VVTESEPVSMSRETTFERDLHAVRDKAELGAIFTRLCEQVAADLQRKGYVGKTIGIKLRYTTSRSSRATRPWTTAPPTRRIRRRPPASASSGCVGQAAAAPAAGAEDQDHGRKYGAGPAEPLDLLHAGSPEWAM
jgi:nucleotidyltransferase/DNA polymerase involved in DNA repair